MKKKLIGYMMRDKDFWEISKDEAIIESFVDTINIDDYILDREYLDIALVKINGKILNVDSMFLDFENYLNQPEFN